nr:radical SAM protein [Candidatus Sigynarchaeota archaeon]
MPFTYGPVPSRRLGNSIGVDMIPSKTCNYSCVYCQLGRTSCFTNTRTFFFPRDEVWKDIIERISSVHREDIDFITFVGNGEPCLSLDVGWFVERVKSEYGIPVAVITNGSLLGDPDVRHDLMGADVILPTCDAGSEGVFRRINRPHPSISFDRLVDGFQEFRKQYKGRLWVEVMLVAGLNDTAGEMAIMSRTIDTFSPDAIYVNVPIRPPAEPWVRSPAIETMVRARETFPGAIFIDFLEQGDVILPGTTEEQLHESLVELVKRHPLRESQLLDILISKGLGDPRGALGAIIGRGSLQETAYNGNTYIQFKPGKPVLN